MAVSVMLQNLLRRRVLEKVQSSGEATVSVDDSEVILRKNKQSLGKQRQRIRSCPDPAGLLQLQTQNINMLDLRTIREQGDKFLTDQQHLPVSLHGEVFSTDSEADKENEDEEAFNFFTENGDTRNRSGTAITNNPLADFLILLCRSIEMATVDRLATQFHCCITELVGLILSLPDGDYKQDMLHVRNSNININ